MAPTADHGRTHPLRDVEVERGLVDQRDAAVVGHHQVEIDTGPAKLGAEPRGRGRQPADRRNRREFSSGEEHAHHPIMRRPVVIDPASMHDDNPHNPDLCDRMRR